MPDDDLTQPPPGEGLRPAARRRRLAPDAEATTPLTRRGPQRLRPRPLPSVTDDVEPSVEPRPTQRQRPRPVSPLSASPPLLRPTPREEEPVPQPVRPTARPSLAERLQQLESRLVLPEPDEPTSTPEATAASRPAAPAPPPPRVAPPPPPAPAPVPPPPPVVAPAPPPPVASAPPAAAPAPAPAPAAPVKRAAKKAPAPKVAKAAVARKVAEAPAAKAPAKAAPGKVAKAAAKAAPAPAAKAPAKAATAPAKAAPGKVAKAATASAKAAPAKAAKAPAKAPPAKALSKAAAKKAAATPAVVPAPRLEVPVPVAESVASWSDESTPLPPPRASAPSWVRLLLTLSLLLLAGAAGLGSAALVESGTQTWQSTVTVRFFGPSADAATTAREQSRQGLADLSAAVAADARVPLADVRRPLAAVPVGVDGLKVSARAAVAAQAQALADAASLRLVSGGLPSGATARVDGAVSDAEKVRPSDRTALGVGLAVGFAVLLLGGAVALIGRGRRARYP